MEGLALPLVLNAGLLAPIDNSLILLSVVAVLVLMALSAMYRLLRLNTRDKPAKRG